MMMTPKLNMSSLFETTPFSIYSGGRYPLHKTSYIHVTDMMKHTKKKSLLMEIFSDKLKFVDTGMDSVNVTYNCVEKLAASNIL